MKTVRELVSELVREINHLRALLRDCAADGLVEVRQAGYQAGWEAARSCEV